MHGRRTVSAAALSALLALGGTAAIASAQDEEPADEATTTQGLTGQIVVMDEDGRSVYYLQVGDELVSLSFGPSWFTDLGAMFGLESLEGEGEGEVELDGNLREMSPSENASDVAKAKAGKSLKVKTFKGESRPKGKPAWAGGPKEQGAAHPGYEGWSKGQANKEAANAKKAEKVAAKAEAKAARAEAKSNRRGD